MNAKKAKRLRREAAKSPSYLVHKLTREVVPVPFRARYRELKKQHAAVEHPFKTDRQLGNGPTDEEILAQAYKGEKK